MNAIASIRSKYKDAAFLIGNGPNLRSGIMPSWKDLLKAASPKPIPFALTGLTNTEIYDLIELYANDPVKVKNRVKAELQLTNSDDLCVHKKIMEFARSTNTPVLTTNFDTAFEESVGARPFHIDSDGFTRFYPWKTYYGFEQMTTPTHGFGIWKIHGDINYRDSIRLGLGDYMGSVQRARSLITKGRRRLYKETLLSKSWQGEQTWLHIWFHSPLIIFGFGYEPDEVFLRWLLIERKRYSIKLRYAMDVWYVTKGAPSPSVKNLMENLDVKIHLVEDYSDIYDGLSD
ncbi:MAG: SIR2 family protein [Imperialibacter sp.]|uniref:SIR2 family protein n=1 Tax=Imperialibacter sp. TaxID=2038411 RepID=UPI0032F03D7F